ncbi:pyridoxine 5'-phosphate synthase [Candidatus Poribacteria bacterium]|nr:MAG: pyridoxine 5'-phosphate synthase [Candidatus Poribacteria bacterium]
MIALSVNVNKVATLRNSRGGDIPNLIKAVDTCIAAGAQGITVHPREDQRHITPADVRDIAAHLHQKIEYNIEGDPRPELIDMVLCTRPTQCTLVPVVTGEITSHTVWDIRKDGDMLKPIIASLQDAGIRVSLFSGTNCEQIAMTRDIGADRIELYTAPYAMAKTEAEIERELGLLITAAEKATSLGMGVNAGHDLNLENLPRMQKVPGLLEVSIGHHLMADALYIGMAAAVKAYRVALGQKI